MRKVSKKTAVKNSIIAKSKQLLINEHGYTCRICGSRNRITLAHLLPRSTYPEYSIKPQNHALLCFDCHSLFDDDKEFRSNQTWAYEQVKNFDELAANKYYQI